MIHEGEYFLIARRDLERFERDGYTLVGQHCRPGYVGMHVDNVIVKRPLTTTPQPTKEANS
ncbi:MAG TPA: hypothetical protein PK416_03130 [Thermodesulfobacteriota bacterium]|nr:hypothetical protein [Thermodesulfobacteriota bacterium]